MEFYFEICWQRKHIQNLTDQTGQQKCVECVNQKDQYTTITLPTFLFGVKEYKVAQKNIPQTFLESSVRSTGAEAGGVQLPVDAMSQGELDITVVELL